ncbi:hypothetical protein A9G11_03000 [Gilliamella sp. wkB108]|uniref:hypothetical protein n=1 Tax=Gilliamella sp. wkB108 TaxID=3120256 RepID=UPI00080EAF3A|nr:hypothetical protein [Gilliamella apicola]OCG24635.1 hypothetical protein A9G11_03000 [Gilliamella apicola]
MKKIVKLAVLFLGVLTFSFAYGAKSKPATTPSAGTISKALADSAKKSLLGDKGKFPLKIDEGMEVTNISAVDKIVVFEYNIPTDSQSKPTVDLIENLRAGLNSQFCSKQDIVNVLRAYDIRFLFRFQYTDNRNVPSTLSIDEICE